MEKMNIIDGHRMVNKDFSNLHHRVIEEASKVHQEEFNAIREAYSEAVGKFDAYISNYTAKIAIKNTSDLAEERTSTFRGFRAYVKSLRHHPDEALRNMSNEMWEVMRPYSSTIPSNRGAVTTMVEATLAGVKEIAAKETYAQIYANSDIEKWCTKLYEQENTYTESLHTFATEKAARIQDSNNKLRDECMTLFYRLFHFAEYQASTKGNENCVEMINNVKVFLKENRSLYTARTNRRARQKGEKVNAETTGSSEPMAENTPLEDSGLSEVS